MAGYIPEEKIEEIRNAADIVDVVSDVVLLKKTGKNFVGLCPFHSEKTPSFTVSPDKQIFHCFGCGVGGNVFSFLMRQEGLSFPEAVGQLARRLGIDLPQRQENAADRRRASEKERLLRVNQQALDFFQRTLHDPAAGRDARRYLEKRGIDRRTVADFQLGYAPEGWDRLIGHFRRLRQPVELLEKAGLVVRSRRGSGYYDRFRNRLIFPIIDPQGRVLGFGGRVLDDGLPKYLNSPETPIYNKRRVLYGLNRTRDQCRQSGSVFIVEGYFDLLALYQLGIGNAVATLGTALTEDHLRLLTRYAERMMLVYDSDEAGLKSAQRCVEVFWKGHVDFRRRDVFEEKRADTRILVLPEGHDPDTFLRQFGADAFRRLAEGAPGIISFLMESAVKTHGLSVEGKVRIVREMLPALGAINDRVAKALYVKQLAERIELDERTVWSALGSRHPAEKAAPATAGTDAGRHADGADAGSGDRFERQIVAMMLQYPDILADIEAAGVLEHFGSQRLKAMGRIILSNRDLTAAELITRFEDPESAALASELAMNEETWTMPGCRRLLAQFVDLRAGQRRSAELEARIKAAEARDDHQALLQLLQQKQKLAQQRRRLKINP